MLFRVIRGTCLKIVIKEHLCKILKCHSVATSAIDTQIQK